MTIRHLKIFVSVAENGKMSTAASKFFISQPAVSQAIKELEDYYGVLLFDRISKKLYITEAGKKLLEYAKNVLAEFDKLEEGMNAFKDIKTLRIGVTVTVGTNFISKILAEFKENTKNIETYIRMNNTKNIETLLLESELDLAVVEGKVKNKELISIPEVDDILVLVCSKYHPFYGKEHITFADLKDVNFVLREPGSGTRELFEKYLEKHKLKINVTWEASSPEVIKQAVINDGCVTVASLRLFEKEIQSGEMYAFRNKTKEWNRSFSVVYHKNRKLPEYAEKFIEIVKENKEFNILDEIDYGILS